MRYLFLLLMALIASALVLVPQTGRSDITPMDYSPPPSGGGVSPKSPHPTIRLDDQEVIIRLKRSAYTVDAVFHLSKSGETTTEWVGFPKNATGRQPGPLGRVSDFIRFAVSVNDQDVAFTEESDLVKDTQKSLQTSPSRPAKHSSWLMGQATFPGNARTTIRVKYEVAYDYCGMGCEKAVYIYGTGSYWKGNIGKATFIIDSTEKGGVEHARVGFSMPETKKHLIHRRLISENLERYEIRDFEPHPDGALSITMLSLFKDDKGLLANAALNGRLEQVRALLKKGVDVNAKGPMNRTPLENAAWAGSVPVVKLLLESGAEVTTYGDKALKVALSNAWMGRGQIEVARFLVDHGAKPSTLPVAAFVGDMEEVQRLSAHGVNVSTKNTLNDPSPLAAAAMGGHPEVLKLLLDKGLQVDEKNEQGETPLMIAGRAGHVEVLKVLLGRGADVNALDAHRRSPLNHAVFLREHVEAVKLLLDRGADINARDDPADRTILMHAAQDGHLKIVKILVAKGADVNARDNGGRTALSLAQGKDIKEIEKFLKDHGARE